YQTVPTGVVLYRYPATGNYTVNVLAKNSSGTVSKSVAVIVTVAQSLVWSDEFDVSGAPDPSKWGYDLGAGGWGNQEVQHYTNRIDNAVVSNGTLKIHAIRENLYAPAPFTSARLLTKDKFAFKYGKVEVSAKVPAGVGTWAAAWMLGANINTVGWPACGEIDIMEHLGREINKVYGTLHYPGRSGGNADGSTKMITNATTQFHKYSLDWSATAIKIYVDDQLIHSVNNSTAIPFNHDFFIILNLAMGGNFGGPVDPSVNGATLEVDYVRVYN
ncbi:MAG: glycoside hydrolase family 16 protein, partial [Chitinophagaceae bacterium]